jgi:hypothetical protein
MPRRPGSIDVNQIDFQEEVSQSVTFSGTEDINKKSISMDGINDHVLVSDQDDFSFGDGSGNDQPFSFSAWVFVEDASGGDNGPFITKGQVGGGTNIEYIFKHESGVLRFFLYRGDNTGTTNRLNATANAASISDSTWTQVVATYDGSKNHTGLKLYTNGSQTAATTTEDNAYVSGGGTRNTTQPLILGKTNNDSANSNQLFEDRMADVCIFNKELPSAEVTELYNSGKVINIRNHSAFSNVVSWWKMGDDQDTDGSNGIRDYVSGYNGTLTNGATIIDETGLSSDRLDSFKTNASGSFGLGFQSPSETLHVYGNTKLEGPLILKERTYDPDNPEEGSSVLWMSNGHGTGDDGDIMIKITSGGVTKTVTLVDFSAS